MSLPAKMNSQFAFALTHPSIGRSLERYLDTILPINSFSFYKIQSSIGIIYQLPIALQLAKGNLKEAQEINLKIRSKLISVETQDRLNFKVTINDSGLLEFFLEDQQIACWLQQLPRLFLSQYPLSSNPSFREINDEFPLQYAHARCCSLLRSGHLNRLIQLETLDFHRLSWLWLSPQPIPFAQMIWQLPERELIAQIIIVLDGLDSINSRQARKLFLDFSKAFFKFERSCRIWGKVKRQNPTLAQARLGLIAIAQLLLGFLLKEKLGLIPLTEL